MLDGRDEGGSRGGCRDEDCGDSCAGEAAGLVEERVIRNGDQRVIAGRVGGGMGVAERFRRGALGFSVRRIGLLGCPDPEEASENQNDGHDEGEVVLALVVTCLGDAGRAV